MPISKNNKKSYKHKEWKRKQNIKKAKVKFYESPKREKEKQNANADKV